MGISSLSVFPERRELMTASPSFILLSQAANSRGFISEAQV
jgi:hypothetical protein